MYIHNYPGYPKVVCRQIGLAAERSENEFTIIILAVFYGLLAFVVACSTYCFYTRSAVRAIFAFLTA